MNIANMYRSLKRILNESNMALVNKGLNEVDALNKIPSEIVKLGEINRLPYLLRREVVEIGEDDFEGDTIRAYAFYQCSNLKKATIPSTITNMGDYAFAGCDNLTDIYLKPINPPYMLNVGIAPSTTTIHVPIGSGDVYKNATTWAYHASQIVEDIVVE